jgi:flagellar hook-associated protein FlgK
MTKSDDKYEEQMQILRKLQAVRERIRRRVGTLPDSSEDIERLREERVDELNRLR